MIVAGENINIGACLVHAIAGNKALHRAKPFSNYVQDQCLSIGRDGPGCYTYARGNRVLRLQQYRTGGNKCEAEGTWIGVSISSDLPNLTAIRRKAHAAKWNCSSSVRHIEVALNGAGAVSCTTTLTVAPGPGRT